MSSDLRLVLDGHIRSPEVAHLHSIPARLHAEHGSSAVASHRTLRFLHVQHDVFSLRRKAPAGELLLSISINILLYQVLSIGDGVASAPKASRVGNERLGLGSVLGSVPRGISVGIC